MIRFRNTYYMVTSCGKIWSEFSKKFLSPSVNNKDGYKRIVLSIDGKPTMMLLHRVVAECYVPNPENKDIVNHKDGIKAHCWSGNLQWSTTSENNKHAIDNNLHSRLSDDKNGMSRAIEYLENGVWVKYGSSSTLARKLGVHRSTITKSCKGVTHSLKGSHVRYYDEKNKEV